MPDRVSLERQFIARTRELRERAQLTQREIASLLGCNEEAYRKYETRSPLPVVLVGKFAVAVKADLHFVVTGYHRKAEKAEVVTRLRTAAARR